MRLKTVQVAEGPKDLLGLPPGSAILTNHRKVFELDQIDPDSGRSDAGAKYWIEPGTLQPFPLEGLDHWFPVLVLPSHWLPSPPE